MLVQAMSGIPTTSRHSPNIKRYQHHAAAVVNSLVTHPRSLPSGSCSPFGADPTAPETSIATVKCRLKSSAGGFSVFRKSVLQAALRTGKYVDSTGNMI
jgi:hypothetical protein